MGLAASLVTCTACAGQPKLDPLIIRPPPTPVPVNRSCVPKDQDPGPPPAAYGDEPAALRAAPDAAARYQLSRVASLEKSKRLAQLEPVLAGCR